jgi:hypothetical protein
MAILPDFRGIGGMPLKKSVVAMCAVISVLMGGILGTCIGLNTLNKYFYLDILIERTLFGWFAVVDWAMWVVCIGWGLFAVSIPARPRETKQRALDLFLFFLLCLVATHSLWIVMFCARCHNFFLNSLAGNFIRETVETLSDKIMQNSWIEKAMLIAVPVLNWISAPTMFQLYVQLPPLQILFFVGWNWAVVAFVVGMIPVVIMLVTIVVVLGYKHAILMGGNGTENVPPSKIAMFYDQTPVDRADIRAGVVMLEDVLVAREDMGSKSSSSSSSFNSSSDSSSASSSGRSSPEEEGSGGTKSSSLRSYSSKEQREVKRIPSYKPNRRGVGVV